MSLSLSELHFIYSFVFYSFSGLGPGSQPIRGLEQTTFLTEPSLGSRLAALPSPDSAPRRVFLGPPLAVGPSDCR